MTLLVMLLTTATAWADDGFNYIGADGSVHNTYTDDGILDNNVIVINSSNKPTEIGAANATTWCVVTEDVSYTSYLTLNGNVNLILANNAKLSVVYNDEMCFYALGSLNIYAQSISDSQGAIDLIGIGDFMYYGIYAENDINIYGGTITATNCDNGIYSKNNDIYIQGGTISATSCQYGIYANKNNITINGGDITTACSDTGLKAYKGNIIINGGIINAGGNKYGAYAENNITIKGGTVTATGDNNGIDASEITITGGTINASGKKFGITAYRMYSQTAANTITINGGTVTSSGESQGIRAYNTITIKGGTVTATSTGEYSTGIYAVNDISITGGVIHATGEEAGICSDYGSVSLNGGKVKATYDYDSTVKVADGLNYTDGNNTYSSADPLTYDQKNTIAGETIQPCIKGKENDNNYWTTFYSGSVGFTIDDNVNAYAYTAEVGTGIVTLHLLGKVIPKETAVIIVSESETITMGADAANKVSTVPTNNLHGVDVQTSTDDITTLLGSGTFYVMGSTTNGFGFHKYTGQNMPARKAFLLINGNNEALARGITMVFDDATGIKSIDKAQIGTESDAWYSLDGRKLLVKPTTKGVYINNGNKVVIK